MELTLDRKPTENPGVAPGPRLRDWIGNQFDFSKDQIEFFKKMHQQYGDNYQVRLGPYQNFVTHDPETIEQVLVRKASVMEKDIITHDLKAILGNGLLTSEGEVWRRQRRLAAPSLKRKQISSYADTMVARTQEMLDSWEGLQDIEIHDEMMKLTLNIVVNTLFGLDGGNVATEVGDALETSMNVFHKQNHTFWRFVPKWVPTHHQTRFNQAVEKLDTIIYDLIRRRRESNEEGDDLLHRLIIATYEDGNTMSDQQLRDESITMFLAGYETTALAMSYSWHVLAEETELLQRAQEEIAAIIGDRLPTMDDTKNLPYLNAFTKELLRVYPPAWMIGRSPTEVVTLAGFEVHPGDQVLMPVSIIHRDPRHFEDPDQFKPDRWLDGRDKDLPRYAYFPFGGGARVCIGNHFAMMEILLCLATMIQRVELQQAYPEPLKRQPAVTLRPVTEMRMNIHHRAR